jgi:hypothetical protein
VQSRLGGTGNALAVHVQICRGGIRQSGIISHPFLLTVMIHWALKAFK